MWHSVAYFPSPPYPAGHGLPQGHIPYRPMIGSHLIAGSNRISCLSIIDSGADHCIFPMSFAHHLGFNPIGVVPVMTSGVGDAGVPMYYWSITIDIGPTQIDAVAGFTEGM